MSINQIWTAYITIVTKEVRRYTRIWLQTLLPPGIMMALYFVIFGNLIGPRIGEMDGFNYMEFIVPGLIMMSVITNSYGNVVSSFLFNQCATSVFVSADSVGVCVAFSGAVVMLVMDILLYM